MLQAFLRSKAALGITFLDNPKLLIGSKSSQVVPSILDEVIALGMNEITFQMGWK